MNLQFWEMKKKLTGLLLVTACMILLSGCRWLEKPGYEPDAISNVENDSDESVPDDTSASMDGSSTDAAAGSINGSSTDSTAATFSFPVYNYPGTDALYQTICVYIVSDLAGDFESPGSNQGSSNQGSSNQGSSKQGSSKQGKDYVCIPCPLIVDIDESNPEDIRVSGEFWCHKYTMEGDILQTVSSENVPGMLHLRKMAADEEAENGIEYEVTDMDVAADDTAEGIFGENYQAYISLNSFISIREIFRTQMLEDYLLLNHIAAEKYQDSTYKSVDLIPKTASLTSAEQLELRDTDGSGQNYVFVYDGQTFTAQYTEDNWKIIDSWKIRNAGDMEMICGALLDIHTIHGSSDGKDTRTAEDMAFEWMQHNFAYEHLPEDHPWRENAKDVDLNPADQGKTFFEIYEDRAQDRFRIGDFLGDMIVYLQMLQEMDPEQLGTNPES